MTQKNLIVGSLGRSRFATLGNFPTAVWPRFTPGGNPRDLPPGGAYHSASGGRRGWGGKVRRGGEPIFGVEKGFRRRHVKKIPRKKNIWNWNNKNVPVFLKVTRHGQRFFFVSIFFLSAQDVEFPS